MTKHIQTICRQQSTNFLSVFDHFVRLAFRNLKIYFQQTNAEIQDPVEYLW